MDLPSILSSIRKPDRLSGLLSFAILSMIPDSSK